MKSVDGRNKVREILSGNRCIHPAPIFDPISARMAGDLKFEMAVMGGSVASLAILAAADRDVLTLPELADHVRRICRVNCPPLLVDAGHGYGNPLNVVRTVQELEAAAAAAVMIEDVTAATYSQASALSSVDECSARIGAAVNARTDPNFVIIGRTAALLHNDIEAALARVKIYENQGADAVCVTGVRSRDQIVAIGKATSLPIVLGTVPPLLRDLDALATLKVRISLLGHQPLSAAISAAHAVLNAIRNGEQLENLQNLASPELIRQVSRISEYDEWEQLFFQKPR